RKRSEVQGLMGYFLNPVALRINLSSGQTVRQLLHRARHVTVGAMAHDDVPLEHLAREIGCGTDPSRHPFFQSVISLVPTLPELGAGWDQTFTDVSSEGARWDLNWELSEQDSGLLGRAQYNPDLFEGAAVSRMLEDWQGVLAAAVADSGGLVSDLPLRHHDRRREHGDNQTKVASARLSARTPTVTREAVVRRKQPEPWLTRICE